jgi:hypothetical protein
MDTFIITCEHGGNRIPAPYRRLFRRQTALLDAHRGYDPGSLVMAKALARTWRAPLVASTTSRLLIDLNRPSLGRRIARRSRDPHFVAQLHPGVGPHGAQRRRRFALPPRAARGGPGVRPLEGTARGIRSGTTRTPQPPLRRQRRRIDLALAHALAPSDYLGIELEVNQRIVVAVGRRWTALQRVVIDSLRTACAARARHD